MGALSDNLPVWTGLASVETAVWLGVLVLVGTVVKAWPAIAKAASEARSADGAEHRAANAWLETRLVTMENRLDAAETQARDLNRKFSLSLTAYRMVVAELHQINPKSIVIQEAQRMLGPEMMADLPSREP